MKVKTFKHPSILLAIGTETFDVESGHVFNNKFRNLGMRNPEKNTFFRFYLKQTAKTKTSSSNRSDKNKNCKINK
jgi:hypothetical protein